MKLKYQGRKGQNKMDKRTYYKPYTLNVQLEVKEEKMFREIQRHHKRTNKEIVKGMIHQEHARIVEENRMKGANNNGQ